MNTQREMRLKKEVGLVFQRWHLRATSYIRARRPVELEARVFHEGRDTQPIAIDEMSCVMMGWKKKPEKTRRYHAHLRCLCHKPQWGRRGAPASRHVLLK